MNACLFLDQFPTEILHTIFNYIPVPELYITLFNVSEHINTVLLNYPVSVINFQSCLQYHVDNICRQIKPDQIISLRLSDDIDRSGQSELFFTYFHIEQLTRLRSLTLIDVENNLFETLLPSLNKLLHLRSFSIDSTEYYRTIDRTYKLRFSEVKDFLFTNCTKLLSQLNRLTLFNIHDMKLKPLSRLRHLKVLECSTTELKRICSELSQLKSFNGCLQGDPTYAENLSSMLTLTHLSLNFETYKNECVSITLMEYILPKLVRLKHFEIQATSGFGLVDGKRWENMTKSLTTFNFKFKTRYSFEGINSFRTSYWLEEKHWFVVYYKGDLFTFPRFAPLKFDVNNQIFLMSNLSNHTIFYDNVRSLIVLTEQFNQNHYFTNVKTLKMHCSVPMKGLSNTINFNTIKHLIFSSQNSISMFSNMICLMPLLDEITIPGCLVPILNEQLKNKTIEQIKTLHLHFCYFENESVGRILCQRFPCIKYLNISLIQSMQDTLVFIEKSQCLLNASFGINSLVRADKKNNLKKLRKLLDEKYSCQIVHSSNQNTLSFIHIWQNHHSSLPAFIETIL